LIGANNASVEDNAPRLWELLTLEQRRREYIDR
jgi:hypothetical protein